jgi:hypothetical protein
MRDTAPIRRTALIETNDQTSFQRLDFLFNVRPSDRGLSQSVLTIALEKMSSSVVCGND